MPIFFRVVPLKTLKKSNCMSINKLFLSIFSFSLGYGKVFRNHKADHFTDTMVFKGREISQTVPSNTVKRGRKNRCPYFTLLHDDENRNVLHCTYLNCMIQSQ